MRAPNAAPKNRHNTKLYAYIRESCWIIDSSTFFFMAKQPVSFLWILCIALAIPYENLVRVDALSRLTVEYIHIVNKCLNRKRAHHTRYYNYKAKKKNEDIK